jgi:ubiquinone/menaquinone biosynthesis C-methylase UbiE
MSAAAPERVGPSGALHGIEPSPEMAAHARHKAEAHRVRLEVVECSADGLPYPPASFDAVFCTLVFHHLPRAMQEGATREMSRVLRPGGHVVIVDWQWPRALAPPMFHLTPAQPWTQSLVARRAGHRSADE